MELIDYKQADGSPSPFPLLLCRNVYVLPGVPHLLQQKWQVRLQWQCHSCETDNGWLLNAGANRLPQSVHIPQLACGAVCGRLERA